ncbi:MAG: TRAP transporter small permease [Kiritimatiellae bacterium]|nr:TRAP transporter small permease [Kiritimatiellia bacterium]
MNRIIDIYTKILKRTIECLAVISGIALVLIVVVMCYDVLVDKAFNKPIAGLNDIIKILGCISMSFALPYVTACKGHIAIEYFFQKLWRTGRLIVDTLTRSTTIVFFFILSYWSFVKGTKAFATHQCFSTLFSGNIPIFWLYYIVGISTGLTALTILHNLLPPRKELIKL